MRRRLLTTLALLIALAPPLTAQRGGRGLPTLAPYRDIVWESEAEPPRVLVGSDWLELLSIDGVALASVTAAARSGFGDDWQRRLAEDLVEVLALSGITPGESVDLGLRDPVSGQTFTRTAAMTLANRQGIIQARRARDLIGAPLSVTPTTFVTSAFDVWIYEGSTRGFERVTLPGGAGRGSMAASMSADGRRLVFHSDKDLLEEGLTPGTNELWLYDVEAQRLSRITRASDDDRDSQNPSISADGELIAFESNSDFLGEGAARSLEIWTYQVSTGTFRRLTRSAGGNSTMAAVSGDGAKVAFASSASLDGSGVTSRSMEIWLADVATGALTRVTRSTAAERMSRRPALDATGTRVVFESNAPLDGRVEASTQTDIWLYDVPSGSLVRVTDGGDPLRASEAASISADGTRIVFHSDADLGRDGHPDSVDEVWLYDTRTGALERLTHTWQPARDAGANAVLHPDAQYPEITLDGRKVVFAADADYLDEGVASGYPQVWVLDLATRALERIDARPSGSGIAVDADGSRIALFRTDFDAIRLSRVSGPVAASRPQSLTGEEISRDLDALLAEVEGRWAYLEANGVDYRAAVEALRRRGADGMAYDAYGLEVQKIIALFIDGHSAVGGYATPSGGLPFLIEPSGDQLIAVRRDRSAFLDADHPVITHIDDRPISEWVEAASVFVPKASPQWTLRNALGWIGRVRFMRGVLGIAESDSVTVQVTSLDGGRTRRVSAAIQTSGGTAAQPRQTSGLIDGDVGYLRLASMDDAAVQEVATWMPRFAETRGLIVDVRGNTGGSRDALRALFPFLMSESDAPRVVNAAKYKLHPNFSEDHLGGSRFMYREDAAEWTPEERAAIARFKETFQPEWTPPEAEFSEWHYLVMSRKTNPAAYHYERPVIVLLDEDSFSATDIFVSAFKGWPGVTLVGTPSGGGSARQIATVLPVSGLFLNLASMASFQIDGRLHDGNGTQPDVHVEPDPGYFLVGGRDNVLERALQLLRPIP